MITHNRFIALAFFTLGVLIQNAQPAGRPPAVPAWVEGVGREMGNVVEEMARRQQRRIDQIRAERNRLVGDEARWQAALDANPGDAQARRRLVAVQEQLDAVREEEADVRRKGDKAQEVVMDVAKDAVGVFINRENAEVKRKEAVAVAVANQKIANQGALDRVKELTSAENVKRMSIAAAGIGGALIVTYFAAKFALYYAQKFVGMPKLVRESSEKNLWQTITALFSSEEEATEFLNDVVLNAELSAIIGDLAKAAQETKQDGIPFRNVILYGEPGTGKTMIAKRIARYCGMDYAILSGADFSQFEEGKDIEQLHLLFDRAEQSDKGLVIFIDEADAALRNRKDMDNRGKSLVDAFLSRTGDKSDKFMMILATNHPQELDPAVLSRFSKKVHIALPDLAERVKILQMYLNKYFVKQATVLDGEQAMLAPELDEAALKLVAQELTGWSGRDLEDLIGELRYVLSNQHSRTVTPKILRIAADEKVKQRKEVAAYEGHNAAQVAFKGATAIAVH